MRAGANAPCSGVFHAVGLAVGDDDGGVVEQPVPKMLLRWGVRAGSDPTGRTANVRRSPGTIRS